AEAARWRHALEEPRGAARRDHGGPRRGGRSDAGGAPRPAHRAGLCHVHFRPLALLSPPRRHAEKKTGHAVEQDRPDVLRKRRAWFEAQPDLDPGRLVFIDETWTATNMARSHGRCRRGERLRMGFPHGHRKTTTLVAG